MSAGAHYVPQSLAEWRRRALGGKCSARPTGPRHCSEPEASEEVDENLPPLLPRGPNPSRSGEGHARRACCSIGISEREQDYLDAQTWWAASPLHSRGLSVPIPV